MSVLQRKELEASPLADLHAIAAELGVEGFRGKRKAELIGVILNEQGGPGEGQPVEVDTDEASDQPEELEPDGPPEPAEVEDEAEPDPDPEPQELDHDPVEEEPEDAREPITEEETTSGVLDILPNGSGFVRVTGEGQSPGDVYISPAQIRRCELRAGDSVSGPVRPLFSDLTPVFPREKLEGPKAFKDAPFGKGSRVAVSGAPGAGATTTLREA